MANADNKNGKHVVIGTVVEKSHDRISITCPEYGCIVIDRHSNWDGGVSWESYVPTLRIGEKVDLLCDISQNGDFSHNHYGFYTLGSLLSSPAHKDAVQPDKVMDFINRPQQEAFVKAVVYQDNNTYIDCWSPVWKKIEFQEPGYFSAKRGDTLIIERKVIAQDNVSVTYKFNLVRNKTLEDEQTAWINKTLSGFTDAERNRVLIESDLIRIKEAENNR